MWPVYYAPQNFGMIKNSCLSGPLKDHGDFDRHLEIVLLQLCGSFYHIPQVTKKLKHISYLKAAEMNKDI